MSNKSLLFIELDMTNLRADNETRRTNILGEKWRWNAARRRRCYESGRRGQRGYELDIKVVGWHHVYEAIENALPVASVSSLHFRGRVLHNRIFICVHRELLTCFSISYILWVLPNEVLSAVLNGAVASNSERSLIIGLYVMTQRT